MRSVARQRQKITYGRFADDSAASVKEAGWRKFNISVVDGDPNHVFVYEVYDNQATRKARQDSDHLQQHLFRPTRLHI